MTAVVSTRFRPDSRILTGLAWRAVLVVAAAVAVLAGLPAWGRAPLTVAAALVTVEFFVRRFRRRGVLDAVLVAVGAVVVVLALLGLLLNVLPGGLSAANWGIAVGVLELVALTVLAYWRAPIAAARRRLPVAGMIWAALIAAVLAGAVIWSVASYGTTHVAPLALAAESSGSSSVVTVTSGSDGGPYELVLVKGGTRTVLASAFSVGPDAATSITVRLPADTPETIELVKAGSTTPLRYLILDSTKATK